MYVWIGVRNTLHMDVGCFTVTNAFSSAVSCRPMFLVHKRKNACLRLFKISLEPYYGLIKNYICLLTYIPTHIIMYIDMCIIMHKALSIHWPTYSYTYIYTNISRIIGFIIFTCIYPYMKRPIYLISPVQIYIIHSIVPR